MIQVVVVDDETAISRAIADSLEMEDDIEVIGLGHNGLEAVDLVSRYLPDVLLMDLSMPVMGGIEALRNITEQAPSTAVLILTVHDDNAHLFTALQLGAKGYLLKDATLNDISEGVRDVARGVAAIPPALAARVLTEFQRMANQAPARRNLYSLLTRQEVEILRLIGLDKSNREIADELCVALTTLKKHITNIRHKLEVNSRTEAVLIAQASGLADA